MDFNGFDTEKLRKWLEPLKIADLDLEKAVTVFTHPSYKGMNPNVEDYERLEFLGDAVLDLISAEELVNTSHLSEGAMTEKRKELVNNENLSQIFDRLKMQPFIRTALSYSPSIKDKANFVEALFGAIFLDKKYNRYEKCKEVWDTIQVKIGINKKKTAAVPMSAEDKQNIDAWQSFYKELGLTPKNAKSMLQELCQKQNLPPPEYEQIEKSGPDHDPVFKVKVSAKLFNRPPVLTYVEIGIAKSKKLAEIKAAEQLCRKIFLEFVTSD